MIMIDKKKSKGKIGKLFWIVSRTPEQHLPSLNTNTNCTVCYIYFVLSICTAHHSFSAARKLKKRSNSGQKRRHRTETRKRSRITTSLAHHQHGWCVGRVVRVEEPRKLRLVCTAHVYNLGSPASSSKEFSRRKGMPSLASHSSRRQVSQRAKGKHHPLSA